MSYSSEVLADSPLGYWRLGDLSGTTMTDASGNGRNGTYNANVVLGATSLLTSDADKAATFNGSSAYSEVAYASWMDTPTAMTIEAWIKTTSTSFRAILDRDDGGGQRVWQFRLNGAQLEFIKISGGVVTAATTGLSLNDGNPHHVVATYDGSNIRLYADGVLIGSPTSAPGTLTGSQKLQIGVNDGGFNWFLGDVDEAAVYGSVLSGTRIAAHYTAGTTASPNATVTPPAATATAAAVVPVVSASRVVLPPAATATAAALPPTIGAGGNATVSPPAATATATAIAPTITQTIPAGTDTSNSLNGRRRRARASVVVTRPTAATPSRAAVKYDKSVPYPPPTLVNGRPT